MITLKQAVEVLDAQVASGENLLNREVKMACGSDMMSDVLAYAKNKAVLLTGSLSNFGVLKCLCTPGEDMH